MKPSQAKPSKVIAFMDTESHSSGNNIEVSPCMRTGDCARVSVVFAVDGGNQAASENVHHSLRTGRDSGDAVVIPINADADRQNSAALTPSPDAEGRVRLRDPGIGIGENGDPMFTVQATKPHAVAFKPPHFTRGKDGKPSGVTPPLSADADKGDQDTVVAVDLQNVRCGGDVAGTLDTTRPSRGGGQAVAFTKAKRAQSSTDDESWVPGDVAPTQNQFDQVDARATTVVAFTQNTRDEVRVINEDGQITGALNAEGGMHQTNCLAFGVTTEQTPKFSEEAALTITRQSPTGGGQPQAVAFSPLQGGRSMPVTPESPTLEAGTGNKTPDVAFQSRLARCDRGQPEVEIASAINGSNAGATSDMRPCVRQGMQVRRLTPKECCRLQGFPDDYLDITFRKKPAADGPKYRALGNSMAVPCMWWLGHRIQQATRLPT